MKCFLENYRRPLKYRACWILPKKSDEDRLSLVFLLPIKNERKLIIFFFIIHEILIQSSPIAHKEIFSESCKSKPTLDCNHTCSDRFSTKRNTV